MADPQNNIIRLLKKAEKCQNFILMKKRFYVCETLYPQL